MKSFFLLYFFIGFLFSNKAFCRQDLKLQEIKAVGSSNNSIDEINIHLKEKVNKNKPFDEKDIKIDLESLGLDDVKDGEKNVSQDKNIAQEKPILEPKKEEKKEEGGFDKIQNFIKNQTETIKKIITKEDDNLKNIEKNIANKNKKNNKKIVKNNKQNLTKKTNDEEKKREEKMNRLNKLKEQYLVELKNEEGEVYNVFDNKKIIVPKEKTLSFGERFIVEDEIAPPILDRYRGNENKHIPIILSAKEKIDIMFEAILNRDVLAFNNAYKQVVNPDSYNHLGDTILTYSIALQRYDVIQSILNKGANPDLPNQLGHNPLDIAIEMMDLKSAQILLDMNVDINYTDQYGRTYLMHAARVGYLPMVQFLVENGADVNASDDVGNTALAIAFRHKKEIIAKYLQSFGAKDWIEKPYKPQRTKLIEELENRWKFPTKIN